MTAHLKESNAGYEEGWRKENSGARSTDSLNSVVTWVLTRWATLIVPSLIVAIDEDMTMSKLIKWKKSDVED